jgi:hypothetical protein
MQMPRRCHKLDHNRLLHVYSKSLFAHHPTFPRFLVKAVDCVVTQIYRRSVRPTLSLSFLLPPLWSIGHPWKALFHFSFLILKQSVGVFGWGISPSQGRYLYKHRQTSTPWVGFEPTIPAFERAKTIHALDRAATWWDLLVSYKSGNALLVNHKSITRCLWLDLVWVKTYFCSATLFLHTHSQVQILGILQYCYSIIWVPVKVVKSPRVPSQGLLPSQGEFCPLESGSLSVCNFCFI